MTALAHLVFPVCRETLCRRHQANQALGSLLEQPEPGGMTWRLPGGRAYETTGDPY
jgi:hypothetical protein